MIAQLGPLRIRVVLLLVLPPLGRRDVPAVGHVAVPVQPVVVHGVEFRLGQEQFVRNEIRVADQHQVEVDDLVFRLMRAGSLLRAPEEVVAILVVESGRRPARALESRNSHRIVGLDEQVIARAIQRGAPQFATAPHGIATDLSGAGGDELLREPVDAFGGDDLAFGLERLDPHHPVLGQLGAPAGGGRGVRVLQDDQLVDVRIADRIQLRLAVAARAFERAFELPHPAGHREPLYVQYLGVFDQQADFPVTLCEDGEDVVAIVPEVGVRQPLELLGLGQDGHAGAVGRGGGRGGGAAVTGVAFGRGRGLAGAGHCPAVQRDGGAGSHLRARVGDLLGHGLGSAGRQHKRGDQKGRDRNGFRAVGVHSNSPFVTPSIVGQLALQ